MEYSTVDVTSLILSALNVGYPTEEEYYWNLEENECCCLPLAPQDTKNTFRKERPLPARYYTPLKPHEELPQFPFSDDGVDELLLPPVKWHDVKRIVAVTCFNAQRCN